MANTSNNVNCAGIHWVITFKSWVKVQASERLNLQWSPEQIVSKLFASHESLYLHNYTDKANDGMQWKNLHCREKKQKQKRKRCSKCRDDKGKPHNRRPLSARAACND
jgi:IS30 family transposase